jgi:hypothetical protein
MNRYLGVDSLRTIAQVRAREPEWFALADDVGAYAGDLMHDLHVPRGDKRLLLAALLYRRVTGAFEALMVPASASATRSPPARPRGCGWVAPLPLGYDVENRLLVINEVEASLVRRIFKDFTRCRSTTDMVRELTAEGHTTKSGRPI